LNIPFSPHDLVFGYGRDSGGDQQDLSIEQQEAALRAFCAEHQLILSHFYKDEARKGSSVVGRAGLQSMMHAFRHGCPERGVIVWKYNRFARSVDNAQYFRAEIRTLGYVFFSVTDHVPEGPMGRLFEAAIDFKDEQYLIDLSLDVKRGLHDLVRIYGCVPGTPPKGFLREPLQIGMHRDGSRHIAHRWQPDPSLTPYIRQAFEMRANQVSLRIILKETHLFKNISSFQTFFSNQIYIGILNYGDQTFKNYCDPIVSQNVWDRVQQVQNRYHHRRHVASQEADHPRRANSRFILSGLAHCALCGNLLTGHSSVQRNGLVVESYICKSRDHRSECKAKRIPRVDFEQTIFTTLRDYILKPEAFAHAFAEISASQSSVIEEQIVRRRVLTTELSTVRHQLTNIVNAIAENSLSQTLNDRLVALESQRLEIESRITALDASAEKPVPKYSSTQLTALIEHINTILPAASDDEQRLILRSFIDRINIERTGKTIRGVIYYYYPPPKLDGGVQTGKAGISAVSIIQPAPGALL
jgi:DNA invertase Pin-like site-specific DNA recombinase